MKKIIPILLSLSTFFMLSCFSLHTFINKDVNSKSKIAVIIGETKYKDINAIYADIFTSRLAAGSKLTVLSQKQVKSVLGSYPERIQGPYKVFGMDKLNVDYTRHDMDSLAVVAKKLNVQYLYVFWIPPYETEATMGAELHKFWYVGELIEFPSRRIIAQGDMIMAYVVNVATNGPKNKEEMCKWYANPAVDEIIKNTNISK